jgi:hypothetical protein
VERRAPAIIFSARVPVNWVGGLFCAPPIEYRCIEIGDNETDKLGFFACTCCAGINARKFSAFGGSDRDSSRTKLSGLFPNRCLTGFETVDDALPDLTSRRRIGNASRHGVTLAAEDSRTR